MEGFMDPGSGYLLEDEPRSRRTMSGSDGCVRGAVRAAGRARGGRRCSCPNGGRADTHARAADADLDTHLLGGRGGSSPRRCREAGAWPALVLAFARGYLTVHPGASLRCGDPGGAAVVIPLVVVCYLSARVKNASPLDLTRLPQLSRQILALTLWIDAMGVPNRPGCPDVFVHGKVIYVSHDILSGAESKLTMMVAREVAHLRLGHRRISPLPAVRTAAVTAMAWLVAVALGVLR